MYFADSISSDSEGDGMQSLPSFGPKEKGGSI
jgi:hypothetical protein